jgi:hypothetical protein
MLSLEFKLYFSITYFCSYCHVLLSQSRHCTKLLNLNFFLFELALRIYFGISMEHHEVDALKNLFRLIEDVCFSEYQMKETYSF